MAIETVLSEGEARALLAHYVPLDETWGAHSVTVARLAGQIAEALAAAGMPVDPALARTGGLLHDIGRNVTHDGIMHCWEGYRMLLAQGQPLLARFCVVHSSGGMTAEEAASVGWPRRRLPPDDLGGEGRHHRGRPRALRWRRLPRRPLRLRAGTIPRAIQPGALRPHPQDRRQNPRPDGRSRGRHRRTRRATVRRATPAHAGLRTEAGRVPALLPPLLCLQAKERGPGG